MITRFQNAVALVTVLTIVNPVIADGFKTWKSQNQKYSVKAKFENYDTDSKQVTLIDRDENTITVQLDQLSSSDQKYVLRRYKRLVAEKNAANPFKLTKNKPEKEQARTDQDEVPTIARWGSSGRHLWKLLNGSPWEAAVAPMMIDQSCGFESWEISKATCEARAIA